MVFAHYSLRETGTKIQKKLLLFSGVPEQVSSCASQQ